MDHAKSNFRVSTAVRIAVLAAIYTGCASQVIELAPNDKEPVREEQSKYGVTCHGPNLKDFQWRGPKGPISKSPQFRVYSEEMPWQSNDQKALMLVFESVKEEDVGNYTCTAVGPDNYRHSISIKLKVTKILELDAPAQQTAFENSKCFIKCKVKGNMHPTFMWSYGAQTFKEKTTNGKYSVEDGGLLIRNVTYLEAGTYTCRAFETTRESSVSGIKIIDLKVNHKPVFLNQMEGDPVDVYVFDSESVNLTCENSAEPPASMKWAFDGSRFIHSDDNYLVTFDSRKKLGMYECTALNKLGQTTRRFHLKEGFRPKTPRDLAVARVGDVYVELQVAPGDEADDLIGYRIEYVGKLVETDGRTFERVEFANFNTTEGPFALVNLKPNTEYAVRALAKNRAGNSEYTNPPLAVRTLSSTDSGGGATAQLFGGDPFRRLTTVAALLAARLQLYLL